MKRYKVRGKNINAWFCRDCKNELLKGDNTRRVIDIDYDPQNNGCLMCAELDIDDDDQPDDYYDDNQKD